MAADSYEFVDPVEDCPWRSPREILARFGYTSLAPSDLNDRQLPGLLWEWLYAAAARRFFFSHTDHLSDRELYTLLWEQWLDEPTADIPLEAETNTRVIASEFNANGLSQEEIYLRYYASEADREYWHKTQPHFAIPPHQDPPYDRDRFLPVPPIPLAAQPGWVPDDVPAENEEVDPVEFAESEDSLTAEEFDSMSDALSPNSPESTQESELAALEPENWVPPAQTLAEEHIPLLPPAEITDEMLTPTLWELLHNLALRGFYISHTDHLNDRELYAGLWHHGLREPALLPGRNRHGGWFHDFLGSFGSEEVQLWLRYYASDKERAEHAVEWPDEQIPPKEDPRFNRDWRLPKGPF